MRSKIAAKMLKETPAKVRNEVRAYGDAVVSVAELGRQVGVLLDLLDITENQRRAWADMCIKKQATIDKLEKENKSLKQKLKKK